MMRFEVPQLSEAVGVPVTFATLKDAKRAARRYGFHAIWEVEGTIAPVLAGRIWGFNGRSWEVIEDTGVCTCGACATIH
jgi:hypothetical protein|uniref:Uncharacterized protein n=1 Tax=uncultured prokaryote TaxID=198431 RepID=A0A0H5Q1Z7_9ZZZZ|nr:hypothetical protein [uncultured prokaryote]